MPNALIAGVTGNVGAAMHEILTPQGWGVTGIARNRTEQKPHTVPCDLSVWQDTQDIIRNLNTRYDLVVAALGTQRPAYLVELTDQMWQSIRSNNLDSAVALTSALAQTDSLNQNALIVYCSSVQASNPRTGRGPYAIAKAGVEALARIAAVEMAKNSVSTIALRLGQLTTAMQGIEFPVSALGSLQARSPYPWATPEGVAQLILNLYGSEGYYSGQTLDVSCGHTLNIW